MNSTLVEETAVETNNYYSEFNESNVNSERFSEKAMIFFDCECPGEFSRLQQALKISPGDTQGSILLNSAMLSNNIIRFNISNKSFTLINQNKKESL